MSASTASGTTLPRRALTAIAVVATLALVACNDPPTSLNPVVAEPNIAPDLAVQADASGVAQIGVLGADGRVESVPQGLHAGDMIPGQFIVIFRDDVSDAPSLAKRLTAEHHGHLRRTFQVFKGFSVTLPPGAAEALRRNPNVSVVEPNRVVTTATTEYTGIGNGTPWGLDRIDQRTRPLSGTMIYSATGLGVYAYIIDTGIRASHGEFGGRARDVATVFGDNGDDCVGHGTFVAGIVGGYTYGVAKQVQLRGVKVLDCVNASSNESVASGIDWVYRNHANPAVANISIQTCNPVTRICTPSAAIDAAATKLAASGVFVAVAAGNYGTDACTSSPARASGTFTVAASTSTDARASYSNWGSCVDAYAPGDQLLSASIFTTYGRVDSGTSFAAPHVAGVAALYKQVYGNVASDKLGSDLKYWATANVITSNYGSTPNLLLFKGVL